MLYNDTQRTGGEKWWTLYTDTQRRKEGEVEGVQVVH